MAANKAIRSKSLAQPSRRRANPHHLKSELFDDLRQFNRGFALSLSALDRLQRLPIFPRHGLVGYTNRTVLLRATANRDILRLLAGSEDQEAGRFARLCDAPPKSPSRRL